MARIPSAAGKPRKQRATGPSARHVLYTGKSGQFAAMSELIYRGYNVAVPEVDVGDDIFVIHDSTGVLRRVQVKTASAKRKKKDQGYSATFSLPLTQLTEPINPELTYMLLVRHLERWSDFLIFSRKSLAALHEEQQLGSDDSHGKLVMYVSFKGNAVTCTGVDLAPYRNQWQAFPPIVH